MNEAYHAGFHDDISKHGIFVWKFCFVWQWRFAKAKPPYAYAIIFVNLLIFILIRELRMSNYRRSFVPIGHKWRAGVISLRSICWSGNVRNLLMEDE